MGTRGAVGVHHKGQLFVTYNHWDSYPDGLGQQVVDFCRDLSPEDVDMLRERFEHVKIVDLDGEKPTPEEQQKYVDAGFYDDSVDTQSPDNWYCLLRNLQGIGYLEAVKEGKCRHWIDSSEFLKDSLFCEYAYILDLDEGDLWFFEGFNKEPDNNSPLPFEQKAYDRQGEYYPVRFKGKAALTKIPDEWISLFYPAEEEVETE